LIRHSFPTRRSSDLPGDIGGSYAYRSNTGRKYDGHGGVTASRGELYGSQFTTGDVVGAGIWLSRQEIFFTKNGEMLGTAFKSIGNLTLFPAVGIHTPGAKVEVNFGGQGGGGGQDGREKGHGEGGAATLTGFHADTARDGLGCIASVHACFCGVFGRASADVDL
jgi:hypothetical protein